MSKSERRNRRGSGSQRGAATTEASLPDGFGALSPHVAQEPRAEEAKTSLDGISILKEVFPGHGASMNPGTCAVPVPGQQESILEKLLGSIATPARGIPPASASQRNTIPCGPPVAPPLLPPPPLMPAPSYQAPQEQWEPPRTAAPPLSDTGASYRERLRAGGRGAFQRGFDAGLVPRTMKDDWSTAQAPSALAPSFFPQQPEVQNCHMQYDYGVASDGQQMWNGAGQIASNECWGDVADQSQMAAQCQYLQQAPHFQEQMPMQMSHNVMPQVQVQQSVQTVPMPLHDQSLQALHMQQPQMQLPQMQMPQMELPQMELPQTPMSQMQVTTPVSLMSGDSTPSDIDRCMAFLMPQAPCDKDLVAAQLKAAAECQCYED